MQRKPSRATTKSTLFTVSKDEWNIKEDTGKYIACTSVCKKVSLGVRGKNRFFQNNMATFSKRFGLI